MSTETFSSKTSANFSIKWSLLGGLFYLLLTVIGSAILTSVWMSKNDITQLNPQQIGVLMDQDARLVIYTSMLAALSAFFCGWLATKKAPYDNCYTAMVLAFCLASYGIVSILIHPEHQLLQQIGKVVTPFLLCAAGAQLAMWRRH